MGRVWDTGLESLLLSRRGKQRVKGPEAGQAGLKEQDPERGPAVPPPARRLSPASTTAAPTVVGPVLGNKPSAGA